jgi:hypothetical protein
VARSEHALGLVIGNRDLKRFLNPHDELDGVKPHLLPHFVYHALRFRARIGARRQ